MSQSHVVVSSFDARCRVGKGLSNFADVRDTCSTSNVGHSTEDGERRLVASPKSYGRLHAIGAGMIYCCRNHTGPVPRWMVPLCHGWSALVHSCAAAARFMMRLPVESPVGEPTVAARLSALMEPGTRHCQIHSGCHVALASLLANVYGVTWMPWVGCNTAFILCFASTLPRPTVVIREEEKLKTTSLSIALDGGILLNPEF